MEQFWFNQPYVLLKKENITNIIPKQDQTLEEKLNAITRLVLLVALLGNTYVSGSLKVFYILCIVLTIIVLIYKTSKKRNLETFSMSSEIQNIKKSISTTTPTPENPMMNVMLPEIVDNPKRPHASRAYSPNVDAKINESVKEKIDKKIFRDLGDEIEFDTSMRQFYTTPNTMIPNDQKGFADFCFGN